MDPSLRHADPMEPEIDVLTDSAAPNTDIAETPTNIAMAISEIGEQLDAH